MLACSTCSQCCQLASLEKVSLPGSSGTTATLYHRDAGQLIELMVANPDIFDNMQFAVPEGEPRGTFSTGDAFKEALLKCGVLCIGACRCISSSHLGRRQAFLHRCVVGQELLRCHRARRTAVAYLSLSNQCS